MKLPEIDQKPKEWLNYKIVYRGACHEIVCNKFNHFLINHRGNWRYDGKCQEWANCPNK